MRTHYNLIYSTYNGYDAPQNRDMCFLSCQLSAVRLCSTIYM